MPKNKTEPSWRECTPPQTPLQRGNFIDMCTTWLVHEPEDDDAHNSNILGRTSVDDIHDDISKRAFVYTRSELNARMKGKCSFCDNSSSHLVLANPFSQRCYILLCMSCVNS
jgi:hypothetical protein